MSKWLKDQANKLVVPNVFKVHSSVLVLVFAQSAKFIMMTIMISMMTMTAMMTMRMTMISITYDLVRWKTRCSATSITCARPMVHWSQNFARFDTNLVGFSAGAELIFFQCDNSLV